MAEYCNAFLTDKRCRMLICLPGWKLTYWGDQQKRNSGVQEKKKQTIFEQIRCFETMEINLPSSNISLPESKYDETVCNWSVVDDE